jgi:hypothetical protein
MKSKYLAERYFHTSEGWYISMRPGDENHLARCGFKRVIFETIEGKVIAGPFISKVHLIKWFEGFVTFFGKNRNIGETYISDEIVIR